MKHVAIIGYGAIARYVMTAIAERDTVTLCGIIGRAGRLEDARACAPGAIAIADSVGDLPQRPDLVLDCAGHAGLREHGPDILAAGIDLYSVSAGALADADLYRNLSEAARRGGTALRIVSGAIGGLDILSAARQGGLTRVIYRGRKPPASWRPSRRTAAASPGADGYAASWQVLWPASRPWAAAWRWRSARRARSRAGWSSAG